MDQIAAVVERTVAAAERAVAETVAAAAVEIAAVGVGKLAAAEESFGSVTAADQTLAAAAGSRRPQEKVQETVAGEPPVVSDLSHPNQSHHLHRCLRKPKLFSHQNVLLGLLMRWGQSLSGLRRFFSVAGGQGQLLPPRQGGRPTPET